MVPKFHTYEHLYKYLKKYIHLKYPQKVRKHLGFKSLIEIWENCRQHILLKYESYVLWKYVLF